MKRSAVFAALAALAVVAQPLAAAPLSVSRDLDVEEQRLPEARQQLGAVTSRYSTSVDQLLQRYRADNNELTVTRKVAEDANALWRAAVADVQAGNLDDRGLYWARLDARARLKGSDPQFKLAGWQRGILLDAMEKASRGMSDVNFNDDSRIRILVTGFDPFQLDRDIEQSNPSGMAALALDGKTFEINGMQAQIEAVIFPVRFKDFDQGMVEAFLTPYLRNNSVHLVTTVSMGRDGFDLERFPGRNRSAAAPDNLNVKTGASAKHPMAPFLNGKELHGDEFVEFSLSADAMVKVPGPFSVTDNRTVTTQYGEQQASSLAALRSHTSVQGSGGGYLSNEISYRSILLKDLLGSAVPVGHIHTPKVTGHDAQRAAEILAQLEALIKTAASHR